MCTLLALGRLFSILKFKQGSVPIEQRGEFLPVRGGQGLSKGRQGLGEREGVAGGLEQGSWGLGRVSKGLGGWGLERAEGLGPEGRGGAGPSGDVRTDVRSDGRSDGRTDGKFTPLSYRTSSPSGQLPKRIGVGMMLMEEWERERVAGKGEMILYPEPPSFKKIFRGF